MKTFRLASIAAKALRKSTKKLLELSSSPWVPVLEKTGVAEESLYSARMPLCASNAERGVTFPSTNPKF